MAIGAVAIVSLIGLGVLLGSDLRQEVVLEDRGLPIMNLSLGGVNLETIKAGNKDIKYSDNTVELWVSGELTEYQGVEIKGRGNATWQQVKKPYQFKFEKRVDLLGLGKNRKWVLLANYFDTTQLRNVTALEVAGMLGMDFAPRGEFVELYADGEYEGLYLVTRKTEVGKGSVDLKNPLGILVELDNFYGENEICYYSGAGNCLVASDVVEDERADEAMAEFLTKFNQIEVTVEAGDWAAFTEVADAESFAEYFLLSEWVMDVDAYLTSEYFYQDGVQDKIHAGPGWDFDMTFGSPRWRMNFEPTADMPLKDEAMPVLEEEGEEMGTWASEEVWESEEVWRQYGHPTRIFYQLMEMPEFREVVERVYQEKLVGRGPELVNFVKRQADRVRMAAKADLMRWQTEIPEEGWREVENFDTEVDKLVDWIKRRGEFMDGKYGKNVWSPQNMI